MGVEAGVNLVVMCVGRIIISFRMTSPKKLLDAEKESTFFGELEKVEVQLGGRRCRRRS
jgi:hypothetical protein